MKRIDHWTTPEAIYDAHVHFSRQEESPITLEFWLAQMHKNGVDKIALLIRELDMLPKVAKYPEKLIPCLWVDPIDNDVENFIVACEDYDVRCIKFYPPHGFHPNSHNLQELYSYANEKEMIITFHMGITAGKIFNTMQYMDPQMTIPVIEEYPRISFLFAHFAPGYFQEFLRILYHYDNVYAETSSSNTWMDLMVHPITLKDVFARTIEVAGSDRIIFGTDSGDYKRGWRFGIYQTQLVVCNELELTQKQINNIFFANYDYLLQKGSNYKDYIRKAKKMIDGDMETRNS